MGRTAVAVVVALLAPVISLAQPQIQGQWQTHPNLMPINPVHVALLHNGKILVVSGSGNVAGNLNFRAGIWDPATGNFTSQGLTWDMFCNAMSVLPDGQVLVAGGTLQYDPFFGETSVSLFDPGTGNFTDIQSMAHGRWYPTTTVLGNGSVMVFSGTKQDGSGTNNAVEIYTPGAGWSAEFVAPWTPPLYPRMHLLPSGKVFYAGASTSSHLFDPATRTWTLNVAQTNYANSRTYGSTVLLPLLAEDGYKARVLTAGGGSPATATTEIIDFSAATPAWATLTNAPMSAGRIEMNAVILPNGKVLLLGGSVNDEQASSASLAADLFDPKTLTMSSAGTEAFARLYHSVALLLPDGRVWVAGGNPSRGTYEQHIEIYSPAYLFTSGGVLATRPTIAFAPNNIGYGGSFDVQTADAANIRSVALIRPGASTHAFDMDQRMIGLSFTASGGLLTVNEPPSGNIAPPGYYMLFVVNNAGVPSIANFVQVNAIPDFSVSATPASQTVVAGAGTSYTISVSALGSFNGSVAFSVAGLPSGAGATFSPTSVTGSGSSTMTVTTGSTTPAGTYNLVVTASSGALTHSTTVTLVVNSSGGGGGGTLPGKAAYPFSEGAGSTTADASGNNNTGTLATGTTWTAGKYGNGLRFDGVNGSVTVADAASLDLGNTGTIAAWVKLDSVNRWHGVIAKGAANNDAVHNYALEINDANRFICILGNGSASQTLASSTTATTGTFYHVACVWDGTTLQLYVNGALNASGSQTVVAASNSASLYVGQFGGNSDHLAGTVDEVRIYNTALSQAQIADAMNTPIQPPAPDTQNPVVNITAPAAGALLSGTVTVTASASDNVGVAGVQFTIDGSNFGAEDLAAPYSISWNSATVANGSHSIAAVARDAAGNHGIAPPIAITTSNDTSAPTVPTGLTANAVSTTQIDLAWNASTDNVGVAGYRITRNGTAIGTTAATTYSNTGLSAGTTYTYTVAANDAAGNFSAESSAASATTLAGNPDFTLSATPASQTTTAGSGTSYTVNIAAQNGFAGNTNLSVTGVPTGATAGFTPSSVTGSGSSSMDVATSASTPAGTYSLVITGTSGSLTHTSTVTLVVNGPVDFSITATPSSRSVQRNTSTTYTVAVTPLSGFSGTVNLSVTGLPASTSASFNPISVTGGGNSTLTVRPNKKAPTGTYTLTIRGTSGSVTRTATVSLTVF